MLYLNIVIEIDLETDLSVNRKNKKKNHGIEIYIGRYDIGL